MSYSVPEFLFFIYSNNEQIFRHSICNALFGNFRTYSALHPAAYRQRNAHTLYNILPNVGFSNHVGSFNADKTTILQGQSTTTAHNLCFEHILCSHFAPSYRKLPLHTLGNSNHNQFPLPCCGNSHTLFRI